MFSAVMIEANSLLSKLEREGLIINKHYKK